MKSGLCSSKVRYPVMHMLWMPQGKGIQIVQTAFQLYDAMLEMSGSGVASMYIHPSFLIRGFKFDLRIYVLITACSPLEVWLHDEGLVRFATEAYEAPQASYACLLSDTHMSLSLAHSYCCSCVDKDLHQYWLVGICEMPAQDVHDTAHPVTLCRAIT